MSAIRRLLARHADTPTLIIGMYVEQIKQMDEELSIPILTGGTPQPTRDALYAEFRAGRLRRPVVRKIASFSRVPLEIKMTIKTTCASCSELTRYEAPQSDAL